MNQRTYVQQLMRETPRRGAEGSGLAEISIGVYLLLAQTLLWLGRSWGGWELALGTALLIGGFLAFFFGPLQRWEAGQLAQAGTVKLHTGRWPAYALGLSFLGFLGALLLSWLLRRPTMPGMGSLAGAIALPPFALWLRSWRYLGLAAWGLLGAVAMAGWPEARSDPVLCWLLSDTTVIGLGFLESGLVGFWQHRRRMARVVRRQREGDDGPAL